LTAAHCFNVNRDISVIYLLVGDHDISTGDETPYPALYASKNIIKHSGYVPTSENQNNDIALLQTTEAIRWKKTVGPACLPFIYKGYDTYFDGYSLTGKEKIFEDFC
jgi:trypsin